MSMWIGFFIKSGSVILPVRQDDTPIRLAHLRIFISNPMREARRWLLSYYLLFRSCTISIFNPSIATLITRLMSNISILFPLSLSK